MDGASLEQIEAIYRRGLGEYRRVAAAICGDRDAAADVVQEAFVRAVRERANYAGRGSLEAWLWRILINTARNHRRDAAVVARLPRDEAARMNGGPPSQSSRVAAAVAALPERQRLVLFLRYFADMEYGTIAEALEISPGTVGATLHAARAALHEQLAGVEAEA